MIGLHLSSHIHNMKLWPHLANSYQKMKRFLWPEVRHLQIVDLNERFQGVF